MMYFTICGAGVSKLPNSVHYIFALTESFHTAKQCATNAMIDTAVPPSGHAEKIHTMQPLKMMVKAPNAVRAALRGSRWNTYPFTVFISECAGI